MAQTSAPCTRANKERTSAEWNDSDVIGFVYDLDAMHMHVSLNASFTAPYGIVFELEADAVRDRLFQKIGMVRYNPGEATFMHTPPAADFQALAKFEGFK